MNVCTPFSGRPSPAPLGTGKRIQTYGAPVKRLALMRERALARIERRDVQGAKAFTLIETLLCLVLLALLAAAVVAWVETAAAVGPQTLQRVEQRHAAHVLFSLVNHDLTTGDFPVDDDAPPRVELAGRTLRIRTRDAGLGAVIHEYRFNRQRDQMIRRQRAGSRAEDRVLLDDVRDFNIELVDETELALSLQIGERTYRRRFSLP